MKSPTNPGRFRVIEKEPFYQAATGMRERNGKMAQYIVWVLVAMVVFGGGHHVVSTAVEGRVGPVGAGGGRSNIAQPTAER